MTEQPVTDDSPGTALFPEYIQRLKRAQGLSNMVEVPRVGYWALDEWDTSEP